MGKSDHNCISLKPLYRSLIPAVGWQLVYTRNINEYTIEQLGRELIRVDWRPLFLSDDVQFQCDFFYSAVKYLIDTIIPVTERRIKNNDKPWVTGYFRNVISQRNKAFKSRDFHSYKTLRNKANRLRKNLKKDFYFNMMSTFQSANPSKWWKTIKLVTGLSSVNNSVNNSKNFFSKFKI